MKTAFKLEICIDSVASALAAEQGGAHRLELCGNLLEGGTTPSSGMVKSIQAVCSLPIMMMIRPRGGDFLYSNSEFEVMKADLEEAQRLGVDGVVFGLLKANGDIDFDRTAQLIEWAGPLSVTFHRAFDMCRNPFEALEQLIELGVQRILTSGQAPDVEKGMEMIGTLQKMAADRLIILAGGGLSEQNIAELISRTGVHECHSTAKGPVKSHMQYIQPKIYMGDEPADEFSRLESKEERVRAMIEAAARVLF